MTSSHFPLPRWMDENRNTYEKMKLSNEIRRMKKIAVWSPDEAARATAQQSLVELTAKRLKLNQEV